MTIRLAIAQIMVEDFKLGDSSEQAVLNGNNYVKELSPQGILGILMLNKGGNIASTTIEDPKTYFVMDAFMGEPKERKGSVQ